jgi:Glyoxalase/Bleomycin resistance protein/Dioxygenase superfamily
VPRRRVLDVTAHEASTDGAARSSVFGPVVQIAYVVTDPERSASAWQHRHGAGPFFFREHIAVTDVIHRGKPSNFDHSSAYGWCGDVMIELFLQHDRSPTAVTERFEDGGTGLHHVACFVPDLDAALAGTEALGMSVATTARSGTTRFAFIDDRETSGHYWELYEPTEHLIGFYAAVRNAARTWDGTDPFRLGRPA